MTEQIGLWRASYTPGDWIVLGGPTSLVVLQPAPAHLSDLVARLWQVVVQADSMDALVAELAQHNISKMPDFAAFFWHGGSMRSLVRGDLEIFDEDRDEVIAGRSDVMSWTEVGLDNVRRVRVRLGSEAGTPGQGLRLPLVVGAVCAGSVELDATDDALVRSPQGSPVAALESARSAVVEAEVVAELPAQPEADEEAPVKLDTASERRALEPEPEPEPHPATEAFDPFGQGEVLQLFGEAEQQPEQQPEQQQSFSPAGPPPPPAGPPAPVIPPEPVAPPLPAGLSGPVASAPEPPRPPADPHNPFAVPAVQDREDDSPGDLFEAPREGMVLAVACAMNHLNPPEAQRCRRCGGPLQGQPRLIPQPVMAVLRPSDGQPMEVDRQVLIGRSPQANKVSAGDEPPRLMTVVSPSTDISRTHLQVSPNGWEVVATDLHSTNGTLLIRPGQPEPERLAPGEPVQVFPGCVLDLGDGVSIHVEHPA